MRPRRSSPRARFLRRHPDDPELITALGSIMEGVASLRRYDPPPSGRDTIRRRHGEYRVEAGGGGSLPAASFIVTDDGVRQRVDVVNRELTPTTAVLALDVSSSVAGETLERLRAAAKAFLTHLREGEASG